MNRILTERGRQLCYGLAVARAHGRVTSDVIDRIMKLVAKGGLDGLPLGGEDMAEEGKQWPPTAEELRHLYLDEGLSIAQLARRYGVKEHQVVFQLRKHGIRKLGKGPAQQREAASGERKAPDYRDFARAIASLLEMGAKVHIRVTIEIGGEEYVWSGRPADGDGHAQQA